MKPPRRNNPAPDATSTSAAQNLNNGTCATADTKKIYTHLKDCSDTRIRYHTWAVVSNYTRLPSLIRSGTKYMAQMYIMDQDCHGSFGKPDYQFSIMGRTLDDFPGCELQKGSVVRIHHMVVQHYQGEPSGRVYDPRTVVVFEPGEPEDPVLPRYKSDPSKFEFTTEDKEKVLELRLWWKGLQNNANNAAQPEQDSTLKSFSEVKRASTFDVQCKILKKFSFGNDGCSRVLRVTDGSFCNLLSLTYQADGSVTLRKAEVEVDILARGEEILKKVDEELQMGKIVRINNVQCLEKEISTSDSALKIQFKAFRFIIGDEFSSVPLADSDSACIKLRGAADAGEGESASQTQSQTLFNQSQPLTAPQENLDELYTPAELIEQLCADDGNRVVLAGLGHDSDVESRSLNSEEENHHQPLTSPRRLRSHSSPKVERVATVISRRKRKRTVEETITAKKMIFHANDDELEVSSCSQSSSAEEGMNEVEDEVYATCPEDEAASSHYGTCPQPDEEELEEMEEEEDLIVIQ